jgi:hypothetical protein
LNIELLNIQCGDSRPPAWSGDCFASRTAGNWASVFAEVVRELSLFTLLSMNEQRLYQRKVERETVIRQYRSCASIGLSTAAQ